VLSQIPFTSPFSLIIKHVLFLSHMSFVSANRFLNWLKREKAAAEKNVINNLSNVCFVPQTRMVLLLLACLGNVLLLFHFMLLSYSARFLFTDNTHTQSM